MVVSLRRATVLTALVASLLWPSAAFADADSDCRSDQPLRAVAGCTELLRATSQPVAERIAALDRRSRAHIELNAISAAETDVAEIFKLDQNSPAAYLARGRVRAARSQTAAALADFNEGHLRAANKYDALIDRGWFFLRTSDFDKARADFEAALQLDATKAAPLVGRALVKSGKGDAAGAMLDFELAMRAEPASVVPYLERGEVHLRTGAARDALADFERVLRMAPEHRRGARGRTQALAAVNRPPVVATAPSVPRPSTAPAPVIDTTRPPLTSPPPAPAAPAPTVGSRSIETKKAPTNELWDVMPVFFGTDRKRGTSNKRLTYVADRNGRLELGRAEVTVPKLHQVPNIERPFAITVPFTSITLYEAAEDPSKHFTIREMKGLTREQFVAEVRARLTKSSLYKDRAVVFIHGYNTDFDFALYRTAQMAYDLKFDGAAFMYSWPSASGVTSYVYDRDSAEQAEPYLREFLEIVVRGTGAKNVSLIAHSMGNLPLLRVLKDIEPKLPAGVSVDQVILAAPDVDRNLFEQLASTITKPGRGVTLYASSKDRAMTAARVVTGGPARAGDVPPEGPVIMAGIDTIDISTTTMESLTLGHSLYAERSALIDDIARLIRTGERPPHIRFPSLMRVQTPRGEYWKYP